MQTITLKEKTKKGQEMQVTFCPEKGMNLVSFKYGNVEIIDQSTGVIFEQRCAGLGALIGPHFHHRKLDTIPHIEDEDLFPHFHLLREQGVKEPFSHGIARYVPWKIEKLTNKMVRATLSSKSEWKGISLGKIEGQEFNMVYIAEMSNAGLCIQYSIVSSHNSLVGLHYYYNKGKNATVEASVGKQYNDQGIIKTIPSNWLKNGKLRFDLANAADYGFLANPHPLMASIRLTTSDYQLVVRYVSATKENSWQLYHPKGSSYVCIEPMSAADPRKPQLSVSGILVNIEAEV
ncbi:MAG: hypothetical protein P4L16_03245 [Chlamydiales bacterium]|nr:hypothetical protein [Chlamydiales bacterium]